MSTRPPAGWHARRAWGELGSTTQRQVVEGAKRGDAHPDAAVRATAVAWARWLLGPHLWLISAAVGLVAGASFTLLAVAIGMSLPPAAPYGLGALLAVVGVGRQRRLARRVLEANAPARAAPSSGRDGERP